MNAYLGKFKGKTMKTIVKHVGSGGPDREWEGPIENWEAHVWEIKHWCDGGEVEYCIDDDHWSDKMNMAADFHVGIEYRIKQREPKPGEVWLDEIHPFIKLHESDSISYDWINLTNNCYSLFTTYGLKDLTYAAPSVEAYYARKFKKECDDNVDLELEAYSVLENAAQLEK